MDSITNQLIHCLSERGALGSNSDAGTPYLYAHVQYPK